MFKFNFASAAETIKNNTVKMTNTVMDNHVVPAAKKLDGHIATAVPVAQAHAAGLALKLAEQAKKLADAANAKGKTLNEKAAENLAALPVKEVKAVVNLEDSIDFDADAALEMKGDLFMSLTPEQQLNALLACPSLAKDISTYKMMFKK